MQLDGPALKIVDKFLSMLFLENRTIGKDGYTFCSIDSGSLMGNKVMFFNSVLRKH